MEFLKYFRTSLFQVLTLFCVLGFLFGVLNLHFSDKTNYCDMTYMFEYPQFVRIHFNDSFRYPAYGLYAYSEGRLTEKARKMRFDGIPVLFLPGNAGSHMQVRSLASVALRKALSAGYDFHFDYFTISYNEELTGLYGGTLEDQLQYAAECINKILDLYTANKYTKHVPKHVIIIGHSMGGVIASRLLAYNDTINSTKIAIALAAPLDAPVVHFDFYQDYFYRRMERSWNYNLDYVENFQDEKMLISFGNGPRDVLVPSALTDYTYSYISVLTTAVPGAWVSPDHVSIVWCKQIVMAINKYLFSLVDSRNLQIVEDMKIVRGKAKSFFVVSHAITLDPSIPLRNATMVADGFWYEDNRRIYQVYRPEIDKVTYLMIRLVAFPQNRFVAIQAINVDDTDWVYGCNAKHTYNIYRYCKHASSLSKLSRWTAVANKTFGKRKLATIHLHDIMKQHPDWTHVIVKVSPTRKAITLNVDVNDHASRQLEVYLPSHFFSFDEKTTVIPQTEKDSLYYEIVLNNFETIPEAYLLYVEPKDGCDEYHVSAELHMPWASNYNYYHYFTHLKRSPMKLRLFTTNFHSWRNKTDRVRIILLLDPRCTFTVSISTSWYHLLGQLVRNYTPILIPFVVGIVIMAAACNVSHLQKTGTCMSFHSSLDCEFMKPYYAIWLGKLLFFGLSFIPSLDVYSNVNNYEYEWILRSSVEFLIYMVAIGLLNIGMSLVVIAMGVSSQFYRLMLRMVWGSSNTLGERLAVALRKVPILLSAVMVAAVPLSSGAAALAVGAVFYAYLLSQMLQDYLEDLCIKLFAEVASKLFKRRNARGEEVRWRNLKDLEDEGSKSWCQERKTQKPQAEDLSNINFHIMMFSLWMVSTLLNLPTLLAWARNFKYERKLYSDPSSTAGLLLSACSGYIWQIDGPRDYLKHYSLLSTIIYIFGLYVIVAGPFSLFSANNAVTIVFCAITLHQLIYQRDASFFYSMRSERCNNLDADEVIKRMKMKNRKDVSHNGRKWNYFGQIVNGTREHVGNLVNRRRNKLSDDTRDNANTNDITSNEDTSDKEETVNKDGKNNNEESTSLNVEGKSNSKDRSNKKEGRIDSEDHKSDNEDGKNEEDNDCEDNGTNDSGLGADVPSRESAGSSDVCDESKIYTVFKNLREKLNFE